jgi:glutamyl-tRNA synthetase
MSASVRVRFAPSPTGPLHIGGVRTALYNYLFARKMGGTFILRVEDTDQTRFVPGAEQYILDSLAWLGISPDEGVGASGPHAPYRQSERKDLYKAYADQLIQEGKAYYAFDTSEELDAMRAMFESKGSAFQYNALTRVKLRNSLALPADEVKALLDSDTPYVIRLKVPAKGEIRFQDSVRDWVHVHTSSIDDKVLMKSDGMPTYHLANVVDDHIMEITHVIRGEEWLPSAPLHVLLYEAFGWDCPKFAHLPLLLRPDGNGKLSKRDGDRLGFPVFPTNWTTAEGELYSGYREKGYLPEAFINMLAFLGWNPGTNQELFSLAELEEAFSLERVGKAGAKFDAEKTKWFQQQHLKHTSNERLADLIIAMSTENIDKTRLVSICGLMKERATFVEDILIEGAYLITRPAEFDTQTVSKKWNENAPALMTEWKQILSEIDPFTHENIEEKFKTFIADKGLGIGAVLPLFRLLITGAGMGPSMFEIAAFLGKEEVIARMNSGLEKLG